MCVDVTDAHGIQFVTLDHRHHLEIGRDRAFRLVVQPFQCAVTVLEAAERDFPDDEWMADQLIVLMTFTSSASVWRK